jgi:hypothetical protein
MFPIFMMPSEAVNTWVLGLNKPLCGVVSCYSVTETENFTIVKYIVPLLLHEVQRISNDPGVGWQISGPLFNGIQCPGEFNLSNILQVKLHCNQYHRLYISFIILTFSVVPSLLPYEVNLVSLWLWLIRAGNLISRCPFEALLYHSSAPRGPFPAT